jgi:MHS family citrate/tricarballylate:H+ symporter-like MFS transporter
MTDLATSGFATPRPAATIALPLRQLGAVVVGNALEFYDFLTFAYFAVYIGRAFFPSHNPVSSLLLSLGTFGAGFVTRPLGALVIGAMGDRIGRKPAMMLSFAVMGLSILGLALTPSFAQIGLAAPVLVLAFRLVQGFALGGEVGPTTAYLVEAAPLARRGLYGSLQYASQAVATVGAGLSGAILASMLSAQQLQDWGWRAAMLIGCLIVPFGLWVRSGLPETLHAADDAALAPDTAGSTRGLVRSYRGPVLCGLGLIGAGTIGTYVSNYTTTYALTTLHLSAAAAFGVAIVKGAVGAVFLPIGGWLSDRFGRRLVMLIPSAVSLVSIVPAFWVMNRYPNAPAVYAAIAWISVFQALGGAPIIVTLTEALPRRIRSGVVAVVYAVAITVFGGSTQVFVAWLQDRSGQPLAPALVWSLAVVAGLIAALVVKETAPARQGAAFRAPVKR